MAWTTPTIRATGYLVTSSDWNTDIVNNLAYLKGEAGVDIEFEDDLVPSAGTEKVGLSTNQWAEGNFAKLYATRLALHGFVRECRVNWESDAFSTYNLDARTTGGGDLNLGGFQQCVFDVTNNLASVARFDQLAEQNNALENDFNASRSPYYRQEFAVSANAADAGIFMGLRQTPGDALPVSSSENYIGLVWTGTIWQFQIADGTTVDAGGSESISTDTRYVLELLLVSGSKVECYLNGTLVETLDGVNPTGALKWSVLYESDGGGGATHSYLTLGQSLLQEDLS